MSESTRDFVNLQELDLHLWRRLEQGSQGGDAAFRIATLATIALDGHPDSRSVVLRQVNVESRRIRFHTDRRSPKVSQLTRDSRVALLIWDPSSKTQLRLRGTAVVEADDAIAREICELGGRASLAVYRSRLAPSIAIGSPEEAEMAQEPLLENLAVVTVKVASLEWLWLDDAGHRRCRFDYSRDGTSSQWLVP